MRNENKINIHCHTHYSDGREPLSVMAMEHKKLGYSACVITDHLRPLQFGIIRYLTEDTYLRQRKEINKLSKYLDYPIIQGVELWLGQECEEILLFGHEVILELFDLADNYDGNNWHMDMLKYIKENKNRCACVLCHPRLLTIHTDTEFYDLLFDVVDGYETWNSGQDWFKTKEKPKQLLKKKEFKNSDAHLLCQVELGDNIHTRPITNEYDLIAYIKGKRK